MTKFPARQQGAILVVSLLMLLVLTVIGVSAMQGTTMQEKMAGNTRDSHLSFQAAEAGLRDGENQLIAYTARPDTCSTAPCPVWQRGLLPNMYDQPQPWWLTNAQEYGTTGIQDIGQIVQDPFFVIDELAFIPDSLTIGHGVPSGRNFYRTTSRATGGTNTAQTVLETTFTRRF